jgi:hypothetical protein
MAPGMLDISTTFLIPLPGTLVSVHPEEFDITLEDAGYLTSLEDFPVNSTKHIPLNEINDARYDFVSMVSARMKEQFARGKIAHRRILDDFRLAVRYGVVSAYLRFIYSRIPEVSAYYRALAEGVAVEWDDMPASDIKSFRPCRVLSFRDMRAGEFSEELLKFLGLCNGRRRLDEIASEPEYDMGRALRMARELSEKYLLLFAE